MAEQNDNSNAGAVDPACYEKALDAARIAAAKIGGHDVQKVVEAAKAKLTAASGCDALSEEVVLAFATVAAKLPPWHTIVKRVPTINDKDVFADVVVTDPKTGTLGLAVWPKFHMPNKKAMIFRVFPIDRDNEDAGYYVPPDDEFGTVGKLVRLPENPEPYGTTKELIKEMMDFIHDYYQAPQPVWIEIMAYYALMTWVADLFASVPYLRWLGEPETGKTRGLLVTAVLCYRPIIMGGATTVPPIFRLIEKWQGTMVIDEADFERSEIWSEITKVLNQGYTRNWPVTRSVGKDNEPKAFDVFGPKLLSTRKPFSDNATETRCITFPTTESTVASNIPLQEDHTFYERAQKLQNKLLQWRFHHLTKIKPSEKEIREHFGNRLAQIGTSLLSVVDDSQVRQRIIDFLKVEGVREKRNRQSAVVIEALRRINDEQEELSDKLHTPELASESEPKGTTCPLRSDGRVLVSLVACYANRVAKDWGLTDEKRFVEKLFLSDRDVGGILRSLGFKIKRQNIGAVVIRDERLLEEKLQQYHGFSEGGKSDE